MTDSPTFEWTPVSSPEPAPGDAHTAGPTPSANPKPNAPQKPKEARP